MTANVVTKVTVVTLIWYYTNYKNYFYVRLRTVYFKLSVYVLYALGTIFVLRSNVNLIMVSL